MRPPFGETVPGNRFDLLDGRWPASPPSVSVIVVHFEQPEALRRTLRALERQTHPAARRETIVVDDGSRRAPEVGPEVRLLVQEDRGARPGAARNLGAAQARGDVLCFLDADTAPEADYLTELTRLPALAPEAVTVGRRRHAALSRLPAEAPVERAVEVELPDPAWLRAGYRETHDLRDADERSYRFVISAVLACTRWFFEVTGPFADFDRYGGEDWEWAYRAWRRGAILAHVPTAVAWHDGPDWSGRADGRSRRAEKNAEALRLSGLIAAPGARGRAVRPWRADTVVRLEGQPTEAATFVCVDSVLTALPEATVALPAPAAAHFAGERRVLSDDPGRGELAYPRLELTAHRPLEADPDALRDLCAELTGEAAALTLCDEAGPLLTIADVRARTRAGWWSDGRAPDPPRRAAGRYVAALEPEPDVEAWLGGWGNSRLPAPPCGS